MIKAGIVGATGYTGIELLRFLAVHPHVSLQVVATRSEIGRSVADLFPSLRGHTTLCFQPIDIEALAECDVVFFATPHTVSMSLVPKLIDRHVRIVDLSADFRIKDVGLWERWYQTGHACPELVNQAVYGLPEINREQIRSAQLVASPGCYPTASLLGFLPLLEHNVIDCEHLIIDAKSGVSGAGRQAKTGFLFTELSEGMKAYNITGGHRHHPEIEQVLTAAAKQQVGLTFVPHLAPMVRGIHATLYSKSVAQTNLQSLFEKRYADEYFVDVLPAGHYPDTRSVRGANTCRIAVHQSPKSNTIVVLSVIDNLVKGASGQAVQNMNIMFGFNESLAIDNIAIQP